MWPEGIGVNTRTMIRRCGVIGLNMIGSFGCGVALDVLPRKESSARMLILKY